MICLKKIVCLLACCCLLSLGTLTAFAGETAVRVTEDRISLTQTQTEFEAVIEIEPENAYAGVEIGVACPEGVAVTASSGSIGGMSAGPVLARGLYWTSFFESDNDLSGTMRITLQLSCPQTLQNGEISIKNIKVMTRQGTSVVTEEAASDCKIKITRSNSDVPDTDIDYEHPADTGVSSDDTAPEQNETGFDQKDSIDTGLNDGIFLRTVVLSAACGGLIIAALVLIRADKEK